MKNFEGKLAVITGGGTGMGRELARQLVTAGCQVAMCDISLETMAETRELCEQDAPQGVVSTFQVDVADEQQVLAFRDAVQHTHDTDHIHLLFNNAGIGGGGSFLNDSRQEWDRTFGVCWSGVYFCTRAFMPMLLASDEGHIINTSSVNGFWASLGPESSHTAYSAAKFAVKGFSEALVTDLRRYAPHVKVSVVMPGHIGTAIVSNTLREFARSESADGTSDELAALRRRLDRFGLPAQEMTDAEARSALRRIAEDFRDRAPTTAAEAATIILDGVKEERWRILVGDDAHVLDRLVRENPEAAYESSFMEKLRAETGWRLSR